MKTDDRTAARIRHTIAGCRLPPSKPVNAIFNANPIFRSNLKRNLLVVNELQLSPTANYIFKQTQFVHAESRSGFRFTFPELLRPDRQPLERNSYTEPFSNSCDSLTRVQGPCYP